MQVDFVTTPFGHKNISIDTHLKISMHFGKQTLQYNSHFISSTLKTTAVDQSAFQHN